MHLRDMAHRLRWRRQHCAGSSGSLRERRVAHCKRRWQVPVLLIYGEHDRNTPVAPSLAGIGNALNKAGNTDYTPIIIPGAAHNLTIQWHPGEPFFWWYGAPGYSDLVVAWVKLRFLEK